MSSVCNVRKYVKCFIGMIDMIYNEIVDSINEFKEEKRL